MKPDSTIYIAGHHGMVGSAMVRLLKAQGFSRVLTKPRSELDLSNQQAVHSYFQKEKPDYVVVAAARVGGIYANQTRQGEFLYQNLMISANVIHAAKESGVKKLLYLGSSCIYPRDSKQPIPESELLTGRLEPTNEGYALAKIAGLKLCEMYRRQYGCNFISAMPTNLYGVFDNFDPDHSHVIPGMMRRFHEAKVQNQKRVEVWGTGKPKREFLFVDDLAQACLLLLQQYESFETINIGYGSDISIGELADIMKRVTGFQGEIGFDSKKPDGMPRKFLNSERITQLGWKPKMPLEQGLKLTYEWAIQNARLESKPPSLLNY